MEITKEMVDYVSTLSRLKLRMKRRKRKWQGELEQIIAYMDVLNTLDTSGCGAHEPCVPGEERAAGGRGEALHGPGRALLTQRAGARRRGVSGAQGCGIRRENDMRLM